MIGKLLILNINRKVKKLNMFEVDVKKKQLEDRLERIVRNFKSSTIMIVRHPVSDDYYYVRVSINNKHYGTFGKEVEILQFYLGLKCGLEIATESTNKD
jgi:hypothetical protein